MIKKIQFEEVKNNLDSGIYELFDDYITTDCRLTILNDEQITIAINEEERFNHIHLSQKHFNGLTFADFRTLLNNLLYYAQ